MSEVQDPVAPRSWRRVGARGPRSAVRSRERCGRVGERPRSTIRPHGARGAAAGIQGPRSGRGPARGGAASKIRATTVYIHYR